MKMKILLTVVVALLLGQPVFAGSAVKDFDNFKRIPVLEGGRLKPLDTFARSVLTQFSGKDHYEKQNASAWLASLFFDPDSTLNQKIFQINNPDTATALGITPEQHRRYTPAQLQKAYRKLAELQEAARKIPEKERSLVENELIRVFENINLYADLSRSFLFAIPQADFTVSFKANKEKLGLALDQKQFSFFDIALKANAMGEMTQALEKKTQTDYTPQEAEILRTAANLFHWSQTYKDMPFFVIPIVQKGQWLSAWDALSTDFSRDTTRELLTDWNKMAESYRQGNDVAFNESAHLYLNAVHARLAGDDLKNVNKFGLELIYHGYSPFTFSIMLYMLTFIFFVISFSTVNPIWYRLAMFSTFTGFAIHLFGLILRIIIMARPPVSSLYETFIFVGFIAVLLGLVIEHFNRQWLGFVTAAICGTAMLFIANKYSADGDTLKMLVAVLNSNFWLATHVTTITIGYGATCVGGVLGHIWLLQAALGKDRSTLDQTYKTTLGILGVALTLTFLGTNLGGIWADQSWGRFWGWDPKENGALMIVLWTALMFHAKVAKMIGALGFAVCAVIGMIVVMWAWFGVNLLSVGLHSYGFTSGLATSLIIYVVIEIIFMAGTVFIISAKSRSLSG